MSINDLLSLISSGQLPNKEDTNKKEIIYNSNELLEHYPMFTKYSLDNAIKKEDLPFFRIGHKRFFKKEAIDKWIAENNKPKITIKRKK